LKKILEDKGAFITGEASGIGLASVNRFLQDGAKYELTIKILFELITCYFNHLQTIPTGITFISNIGM